MNYLVIALYVLGAGMTMLFFSAMHDVGVYLRGYGFDRFAMAMCVLAWPLTTLGLLVLSAVGWLRDGAVPIGRPDRTDPPAPAGGAR